MRYKKIVNMLAFVIVLMEMTPTAWGQYGKNLCNLPQYECLRVQPGDSWGNLFPDARERMIVKKVNRMNTPVHAGMLIAVPRDLEKVDLMDLAPFPRQMVPIGSNFVQVDLSQLAWGAYDVKGNLVNWGPISGGKSYCPDIRRGCQTITGTYTFYSKQGPGCISSAYPIPHGGAPMPYCMHFKGGYAMHGSTTVPGQHASHGCVRLFFEDALWLNREFVRTGYTQVRIVP